MRDLSILMCLFLVLFAGISLYTVFTISDIADSVDLKLKSEPKKCSGNDDEWIPFPKNTPRHRGWHICSIRYGTEPGQAYVMDLFWDDEHNEWRDNRRIDVFNTYSVYNLKNERLYNDYYCKRSDVIAFKEMPEVYEPNKDRRI